MRRDMRICYLNNNSKSHFLFIIFDIRRRTHRQSFASSTVHVFKLPHFLSFIINSSTISAYYTLPPYPKILSLYFFYSNKINRQVFVILALKLIFTTSSANMNFLYFCILVAFFWLSNLYEISLPMIPMLYM
jgi:hypothetical protein